MDWKRVEKMRVRERIDLAFHVMEREYAVTRLLDPEGKRTRNPVVIDGPRLKGNRPASFMPRM